MGSRVTRALRNFNLENRVHREIDKAKPKVAPRHPSTKNIEQAYQTPDLMESIHKKNEPLLRLLKSVYVESKDPPAKPLQLKKTQVEERRLLKISLPNNPYGISEITDVPKGKLSIVEALNALNQHKRDPKTWTPERIAQEYSLDLKDAKALLEFFIPFDVKIIPPKSKVTKKIEAS
ncbi:NADH dehydrogenase [ubiquinone] 1 alpha subcomplex assembly factor 4 [Scleropages formosus]|uniref:NADH dehydrogenase [ubiquinone] 1 alpha subcomplex assembly factor 4 n=2 Tax=Scleropages formosus TaxID=113540 RepID=A0A8C9SAE9_SCLFO|nr:NADH dehydrogenase [ubiquinone] 1 alpha subcomplex assembly factor 4 [Scleropages formosus]